MAEKSGIVHRRMLCSLSGLLVELLFSETLVAQVPMPANCISRPRTPADTASPACLNIVRGASFPRGTYRRCPWLSNRAAFGHLGWGTAAVPTQA